jgi:hypothetical protein
MNKLCLQCIGCQANQSTTVQQDTRSSGVNGIFAPAVAIRHMAYTSTSVTKAIKRRGRNSKMPAAGAPAQSFRPRALCEQRKGFPRIPSSSLSGHIYGGVYNPQCISCLESNGPSASNGCLSASLSAIFEKESRAQRNFFLYSLTTSWAQETPILGSYEVLSSFCRHKSVMPSTQVRSPPLTGE